MRGARLHGRRGWRRGRVVWLGGVGVCSAAFYPPKCPPTSFSTTVHSSSSTFFCRFPRPYNDVVTLLYQLLVPLLQLYYSTAPPLTDFCISCIATITFTMYLKIKARSTFAQVHVLTQSKMLLLLQCLIHFYSTNTETNTDRILLRPQMYFTYLLGLPLHSKRVDAKSPFFQRGRRVSSSHGSKKKAATHEMLVKLRGQQTCRPERTELKPL